MFSVLRVPITLSAPGNYCCIQPCSCYYVGSSNAAISWQVLVYPATIVAYQQCCHPVASIGAPSYYYWVPVMLPSCGNCKYWCTQLLLLGTSNAVILWQLQVLVHPGYRYKIKTKAASCSIFILIR